ncbi:hypothetical protein QUF76_14890 [Desulfobacterales bacterium HSG16]|nr:hypothetical protein [Desulfobacterales bacterium HSG16]
MDRSNKDKAYERLCKGLTIKLSADLPLAEGKILSIRSNKVITNIGKKMVKPGMHLIFYQMEDPIIDEDTGEVVVDAYFEEFGTARLEKVLEKASFAKPFDMKNFDKLKKGLKVVMK